MFKKLLCLLLAGLMLLGTVSCANSGVGEDTTAAHTREVNTSEDTELKPELPDETYEGASFRILTEESQYKYIVSEKTDGTLVNDAIVESNMTVIEQFDIQLERINGNPEVLISSGDDAYDVAYLHDCTTATLSLRKFFRNVYEMPYMDPTAPWWPQFTTDALTLNGKMFFFSNYTGYLSMMQTRACVFNQDILMNYNIEAPYDLVRAGTWTLDKAMEMSTAIYSDLNGNGVSDKDDLFGFAATHYPWGWLEAFGIELYQKESPNSANINVVVDDRCYTLIEKLNQWFFSGNNSVMVSFSGFGEPAVSMFADGRVAFTFTLNLDDQVRPALQNNINYGILPFPKIDVNQTDYYGACTDYIFSIPITIKTPEMVGAVLEAMAYNGYKYVRPAYCEQTLQSRYATDPDCAEMLNLILENRVISFAYLFSETISNGMQANIIAQATPLMILGSLAKSRTKAEQKSLKKVIELYAD